MPSERTIRRQLTNTYLERAKADAEAVGGRFSQEERYGVTPDVAYPPSAGPFNDAVAQALNSVPDTFGVDQTSAPVVGEPHERGFRRELAQSASPDLAALSPEELEHRKAWALLAQKHLTEDVEKIDRLQAIVDAVEAEQRRRRI